ncbi:hypothetical protein P8X24_04720 [Pyrococcus kukulkanii]|uniref:hypothetical protein n=1 Tax=Pyrococcus kukulkanii TaxID=1609559 RepID=UPI001F33350D|nr:hypothetical protein [Pyrococcus kukulkanii]
MSSEALEELTAEIALLAKKDRLSENWPQVLANFLNGMEVVEPKERFETCHDKDDNKWLKGIY